MKLNFSLLSLLYFSFQSNKLKSKNWKNLENWTDKLTTKTERRRIYFLLKFQFVMDEEDINKYVTELN